MQGRSRTIGRLAKEVGVGVETIRFYERRGLLIQPERPKRGGYRHYEDDAVQLLRHVRLAQNLGLSLKDIEQLLLRSRDTQVNFCQAVRETITAKLKAVRSELEALRGLEIELDAFLTGCAERDANLPCPILVGLGQPVLGV